MARLAEFRGMRRTTVPGKIGWGSAGEDPGLQEPAGDESRRFRLAKTHGGVEPVGHEVAETVAPQDLHRQLRISRQEFAEARGEDEAREERIDIDPEPAAHDRRRARRLGGGVLDARQQRLHLLIEAATLVG